MDSRTSRILVINVSVIFVVTSILEMTLHEAAHFVASEMVGSKATLYHNCVLHEGTDSLPINSRIFFAAAGPVASLLIGLLFGALLRLRRHADLFGLFLLYMSVFGYIGFLGYTMIAPFFTYGDTGFVLAALGAPLWVFITVSVASIAALYMVMRRLACYFVSFMSAGVAADKDRRSAFVSRLIMYPFIIGTIITTLLNLPSPTPLSLIAPICSPFSILWVYHEYKVTPAGPWGHDEHEAIAKKVSIGAIALLLLTVIVNRLLVNGFQL